MTFSITSVFGIYPPSEEYRKKFHPQINSDDFSSRAWGVGFLNWQGYIPVYGGIQRIITTKSVYQNKPWDAYAITHVVRGVAEILCLGLVLALIDILFSLGRVLRLTFSSACSHAQF